MEMKKRVIALGFFDGVHIAHGALLRRVREVAETQGAIPAAVTFDRHPKAVTGGEPVPLLNTPEDRERLMKELYGIQEVVVLPFDRAMREMPWRDFVTQVLAAQLGAVHVVVGHDNRFGYRGEGNAHRLSALCRELGLGCDIIGRMELDGVTISSTHIRSLILAGDLEGAARYLGHPHVLSGTVIHGKQLGHTLGVPTCNLAIPSGVIIPPYGVYATRVSLGDQTYLAATNVGVRPTVDDGDAVTVEPWLLDYQGDLYGRTIRVAFHKRLRPERRFDSLEALREEILRNAAQTRAYFEK
jgi:riboflavin kinase/FMN adenylyltransferase